MKIIKKMMFFLLNFIFITIIVFFVQALWDLVNAVQDVASYQKKVEWAASKSEQPLQEGSFEVFQKNRLLQRFTTLEEAIYFAENFDHSFVREINKSTWLWDNYPPFNVYRGNEYLAEFHTFLEALEYAKTYENTFVYFRGNNGLIWSNGEQLAESILISAPLIRQYPELPRGCEVTSLAMLLQYAGIDADKITLSQQIQKDPTPYKVKDGKTYFGNPYDGFVGSMEDLKKPGYGVYHGPIYKLLKTYMPDRAIDLTGAEFEDLFYLINQNVPVWVVTNTRYTKLSTSEFMTWITPTGSIEVTNRMHAVLLTGYDQQFVYFNDPLVHGVNKKVSIEAFKKAWIQMGSQAVSYSP